ncbi:uncharacterized protein E0L32_003660 [Thyridium curvatum]|uniref:Tr-type G domain-containing protein n=1 Tax=Thyridium curvatum TaxID=1093900 RepID=A0A507BHB8_9PEZI|nr:uncharacterized protein E0L32_003660 [Thyridium curvatum]TPX16719.1 hypothetical protein E0L32_003660 [Thyridium curvatum]
MSVFTFDPNPQRVSSPWLPVEASTEHGPTERSHTPANPTHSLLSEYGVTRLPPEPQEGPTEYKLHLLLRSRRTYTYTSTAPLGSRSATPSETGAEPTSLRYGRGGPASTHSQLDRLIQLTTQLLWRLRQTCPYHASTSSSDLVVPKLVGTNFDLAQPPKLAKVWPGLEESRGALYEIGVADDGTLVGLTQDELGESIARLRAMAASLGCDVEVLRKVIVGKCEWGDKPSLSASPLHALSPNLHQDDLWVAEALVRPVLESRQASREQSEAVVDETYQHQATPQTSSAGSENQLRVTLTGPTTSGKTTLLGTLSTGTLDNGQGMSRLSLLKHRHEVASGVTSSVTQELIGYRGSDIVNYANQQIESWVGIHDFTGDGRLAFVSDVAGHPRYRRTILRGIVGWAPQWTLLCIAADDADSRAATPGPEGLGPDTGELDLAKAHLDLCLKLELPLAIVITKLDLANKAVLRSTLEKIWTSIKAAGRTPKLLPSTQRSSADMPVEIAASDDRVVREALRGMATAKDFLTTVPVVLTSAVRGDGVGLVHALLKNLPLPPPPTAHDLTGVALNPEQPASLYHIEEKFSLPATYAATGASAEQQDDAGTVVAGYLRFGSLAVGDQVVVGPFPSEEDDEPTFTPEDRPSPGSFGLSLSHPSSSELSRVALRNAISASTIKGEWHSARIVTIRNLRLPVETLAPGQVGTIGLVFEHPQEDLSDSIFERPARPVLKIRKGMVLAIPSKHMIATGLQLQAASGLTAVFTDQDVGDLAYGVSVTIYVASVRVTARVARVIGPIAAHPSSSGDMESADDMFTLSDQIPGEAPSKLEHTPNTFEVKFELLNTREWIELGSRIVILEGANKDGSALSGFVGRVVEIVD